MTTGIILAIVGGLLVVYAIALYNRMRTTSNQVDNAWSGVDVELKRRYDLVPNLVETVKGYAAHERQVLENVTAARAAAVGAKGVAEQAKAETGFTAALRSLFAVSGPTPS